VNGIVSGQTIYSDTGTVNAMKISTGATAYTTGLTRYLSPAFTNTSTAVTLADTKLTAKAVAFPDGSLPAVGQIVAGRTLYVIYNGTNWEIQNLSSVDQSIFGNLSVGGNETVTGTLGVTGIATLTAGAVSNGDVKINTAGKGLYIKEGTNATMGTSGAMTAGSLVVSTTKVTASSRIFLTVHTLGTVTTPKALYVSARTPGTSFTVTSADGTDTSTFDWLIMEPA
jgi:hypothetical protein